MEWPSVPALGARTAGVSPGACSRKHLAIAGLCVLLLCAPAWGQAWITEMQQVHTNFTGAPGTIARFGDSISCSWAYFYPLQYGHSYTTSQSEAALTWIQTYSDGDIWTWQHDDPLTYGGQTLRRGDWCGNRGTMTSRWPLQTDQNPPETNVSFWLSTSRGGLPVMNPEIAVIMFGTNDVSAGVGLAEYEANMLQITQTCKANGTIPILVTPLPRHNRDMSGYAQAIHNIAAAENVPVAEYYEECVARRPHNPPTDTWDGANAMWSAFTAFEVPTLTSRDGVHPSNWSRGRRNFGNEPYD